MSPEFNEEVDVTKLDVVADRVLTATIEGKSFEVIVRFWKPMPHPKGDWICSYTLIGIGNEKLRYAAGIDAVQALQLAMFAVGAELSGLRKDVELTFLDENHCGFPSTTREATGSCPYCRHRDTEC
jgi:hypothetical protein